MPSLLIRSDLTIRGIKPGDPRKRLSDGNGLYLLLFVKGGSHGWRLDYSVNAKRKTLSLGTYPETSLAAARTKAEEARSQVAAGIDPSDTRKATRAETIKRAERDERAAAGLPSEGSFEEVARRWFEQRQGEWAQSYASKLMRRLEVDVFPFIGTRGIGTITPPELLETIRRIEARGVVETAHRALESCSQVFRFAIAEGHIESDPARDLKGALSKPKVKHFAAITEPRRLGELLRAIAGYQATPVVRAALGLQPMLLMRPGELRMAAWAEFDLDAATWQIPAHRMKREVSGKLDGKPHFVPLPAQAVAILRELHAYTGSGALVFRGERHHDRPMSENTVNAALRAMGFAADEVTGHGFRATARTLIAEHLDIDAQVIEAQLAHSVPDSLGRAYNRTEFEGQRRAMLQAWADYLDKLRKGADVIDLRGKAA